MLKIYDPVEGLGGDDRHAGKHHFGLQVPCHIVYGYYVSIWLK